MLELLLELAPLEGAKVPGPCGVPTSPERVPARSPVSAPWPAHCWKLRGQAPAAEP